MATRMVLVIHGEEFPLVERIPLAKWREIQRVTGRKAFDVDLEDWRDADAIAANAYLSIRDKYPDRSEAEVTTFVGTLELGVNMEARSVEVAEGDTSDPPTALAAATTGPPNSSGSTPA